MMSELLRAKCKLYLELLKEYNVEGMAISEGNVNLMDSLLRDSEVQSYIQSKLNVN